MKENGNTEDSLAVSLGKEEEVELQTLVIENVTEEVNKDSIDDKSSANTPVSQALKGQTRYSLAGLITGSITLVLGAILIVKGIQGKSSLIAKMFGLELEMNDAPYGLIMVAFGSIIIWITRYKVRMKNYNQKIYYK